MVFQQPNPKIKTHEHAFSLTTHTSRGQERGGNDALLSFIMFIDFSVIQKAGTPHCAVKPSFLVVCTWRGAHSSGRITHTTCQATALLPCSPSDIGGERVEDSKNCSPFSATFFPQEVPDIVIFMYSCNMRKDTSIRLPAPR